MKKILLIVLVFFAIVVFSGCNLNNDAYNKNKYINIEFFYNDEIYEMKVRKGSRIYENNLNFVTNKNDIMLFYGENYEEKYCNEVLNEDIKMLVCDFNGSKEQGKLYTLSEAYNKHYITKNDLIDIKNNYTNSDIKLVLDKIVELKILNDRLLDLKENIKDAKMEDIYIIGYYGNFYNSYVIRVSDDFGDYPAVVKKLNIDDILFEYSGPEFLVWVNK